MTILTSALTSAHFRRRTGAALLALALLERARRHDDPAALAEARTIYEELGAVRWLGRLEATIGVTA